MIDNYWKTISFGLKLMGVIKLNPLKKTVFASVLNTTIFLLLFYDLILGFYFDSHMHFIDFAMNFSVLFDVFIRLLTVELMQPKIKVLVDNMEQFWPYETMDEKISQECGGILKRVKISITFLTIYCFIVVSACTGLSLVYGSVTELIQFYRPEKMPVGVFHLCKNVVFGVVCLISSGCDSIFAGSVFLVLIQYRILRKTLCDQFDKIPKKTQEYQSKKIKECVLHHIFLNRQVKIIEDIFGLMQLIFLWMSITGACLFLYDLTTRSYERSSIESTKQIISIIYYVLQLFFFNFLPAQLLSNEIGQLSNSLYSTNWYNQPPVIKKSFGIILMRSQKNTFLMAGKIVPMNFETYLAVMRLYYSVYAFLTTAMRK